MGKRVASNRKPQSEKKSDAVVKKERSVPGDKKEQSTASAKKESSATGTRSASAKSERKVAEKKPVAPDPIAYKPDLHDINIAEDNNLIKYLLIGIAVAVVVFAIGVGIFFWAKAPGSDIKPQTELSKEDKITEAQLIESYNKGDYAAVIPRMEEFVAENKGDLKVRDMLASAYLLTGNDKQALDEYQEILKIKPGDAEMLYKMGILLERTSRRNEAIAALSQAVQSAPNVSLFHAELARLNTKAKYYTEAIDQWKAVLNLLPAEEKSRADVFAEMANIYILQNDYVQARGIIVTGLGLDPDNDALKALKAKADDQESSAQPGVTRREN